MGLEQSLLYMFLGYTFVPPLPYSNSVSQSLSLSHTYTHTLSHSLTVEVKRGFCVQKQISCTRLCSLEVISGYCSDSLYMYLGSHFIGLALNFSTYHKLEAIRKHKERVLLVNGD